MCRFVLYLGKPIHLSSLVTEPENSLIHQSFDAKEREEPLNGDGFGLAWYPQDQTDAALFRSITPAWNNQNLRHISRAVRSECVLAHVRAASMGLAVSEANTHPFVAGPYAFMHNGEIGNFKKHRRVLMDLLDEPHYESVEGSTDSECLFAHVLQQMSSVPGATVKDMAEALEMAMTLTLNHLERSDSPTPSFINAVLTDGQQAVACRFTNSLNEEAASLHLHTGLLYTCKSGKPELIEMDEDDRSVIVASEPLTDDSSWTLVPPGSMIMIDRERNVSIRAIQLGNEAQ